MECRYFNHCGYLLEGILICSLCAVAERKGLTERLLPAIRDADAREESAEVVNLSLDHGADLTAGNILGAAALTGEIRVALIFLE